MNCVYIIRHNLSDLFYIGSTGNFRKRRVAHLYQLRNNNHHSRLMQYAYNSLGTGLTWETIPTATKEEAMELERKMLIENKDNPKLVNERLVKPVSAEVRQTMSIAHKASWTDERKTKQSKKMSGKKHTEETKQYLREINKDRNFSNETRAKAAEKNRVGITAFGVNYRTALDAAAAFSVDIGTILNRARSDKPRWCDWSITPKE
ncbi:GIY-YIG catalytic domain protein [compost metagenome]